jgi:hypothetical protein
MHGDAVETTVSIGHMEVGAGVRVPREYAVFSERGRTATRCASEMTGSAWKMAAESRTESMAKRARMGERGKRRDAQRKRHGQARRS